MSSYSNTDNDSTCSANDVPECFTCPLTMDIMKFPMLHPASGHHFEREAILGWMYRGNATCPLTRKPIHPNDLELDESLMEEIQRWKISEAGRRFFEQNQEVDGEDDEENDLDCSDRVQDVDDDDDDEFDVMYNDVVAITQSLDAIRKNIRRNRAKKSPVRATVSIQAPPVVGDRLMDIRQRIMNMRAEKISSARD